MADLVAEEGRVKEHEVVLSAEVRVNDMSMRILQDEFNDASKLKNELDKHEKSLKDYNSKLRARYNDLEAQVKQIKEGADVLEDVKTVLADEFRSQ